ncbi:MAG: hypothetical protein JXR78_08955 [Victivallales bacterium]|nr:hypothetical protein [Victivallales bacterium]
MRNNILSIALSIVSLTVTAAGFSESLKISPSGELQIDPLTLRLVHWGRDWHSSHQGEKKVKPAQGYPVRTQDSFELYGDFGVNGGEFKLKENVRAVSADMVEYGAELSSEKEIFSKALALSIRFPVKRFINRPIIIDGKKVNFEKYFRSDNWVYSNHNAKEITIPVTFGILKLKGDFSVHMQDDRKFNGDSWELRLRMKPETGNTFRYFLKFSMHIIQPRHNPVNLSHNANMGFSDAVANDGKGGWTDQGPDNDLSGMVTGRQMFCGIEFDVIDSNKNDGKSCIVLRGKQRQSFPLESEIVLPQAVSGQYLYLLHAIAWEPNKETEIGEVRVEYTDNEFVAKSEGIFPIKSGIDVANFWLTPRSLKNCAVGWRASNERSEIGLYVTRLNLTGNPVKKITFSSAGKAVWMIAGATLSNHCVDPAIDEPVIFKASQEWLPLNNSYGKVRSSSILDFSEMLDAPAGKYGFVRVAGDVIEFEKRPGKTARFYGTNIAFGANFLDRNNAEKMVADIASTGYNLVRLHHFDRELAWRKNGSSTELNPKLLDRLDYLVATMKKRGIYTTLDLFVLRHLEKGELPDFPDRKISYGEFKALVFVNESAMQNFLEFSANLLNHVNPYTGLAWKDDPAIVTASLINEDAIFATSARGEFVPKLFQEKYKAWLAEKNLIESPDNTNILWKRFLISTYLKGYARIYKFMQQIGLKAPITDQNHWNTLATTIMREQYDFVDNHFYWGHPKFLGKGWSLPASVYNQSAIGRYAGGMAEMFPTRIFGKPFSVTEWDYVNPNEYNVEGAFLTGAYAALQDWSILCRFAYAHNANKLQKNINPIGFFDCHGDPLRLLSERAGVLFFLRGDVAASKVAFPFLLNREHFQNNKASNEYPVMVSRMGLIGKTGTLFYTPGEKINFPEGTRAALIAAGAQKPDNENIVVISDTQNTVKEMRKSGFIKSEEISLDGNRLTSSTGELTLDRDAMSFKALTPASEGFVMKADSRLEGKFASVDNQNSFAAFLIASRDDKPLRESKRILILHLTDTKNTNIKFRNGELEIVEEWGELPLLVRRGNANITINSSLTDYRLFAVDMDGSRMTEIPLKHTNNQCSFTVDTLQQGNIIAAYELIKD